MTAAWQGTGERWDQTTDMTAEEPDELPFIYGEIFLLSVIRKPWPPDSWEATGSIQEVIFYQPDTLFLFLEVGASKTCALGGHHDQRALSSIVGVRYKDRRAYVPT